MKKILVVDDQPGIRVLLAEVFSTDGYQVYQTGCGKLALEILQKELPDLMLLDIKMPQMNGVEVLSRMNQIKTATKVIMMTAFGEKELIAETIRLGALTCFSKPFDIDEMRRYAVNVLSESEVAAGAESINITLPTTEKPIQTDSKRRGLFKFFKLGE